MASVEDVPDATFDDPRLAALYDPLDPDRSDLDAYAALADELGARTVLDIGCGTGVFAILLAERGLAVTGVDPAGASVDVARRKPGADGVTWVVGEARAALPLQVDLVTMTANVAQVFTTDAAWREVLAAAHDALRPGGHLAFETRVVGRRAWEGWTREASDDVTHVDGVGPVRTWHEVVRTEETPDGLLVTFDAMNVLPDGTELASSSTLRFPTREQVQTSLAATGFELVDVRDAPDRPGLEWVFVARRPAG